MFSKFTSFSPDQPLCSHMCLKGSWAPKLDRASSNARLHIYQHFSDRKSGRYVLIGQLLLQAELVRMSKADIHIKH